MAPPLQEIFVRPATAALPFLRRPAGFLGPWTQTPADFTGSKARYAGPDAGAAQTGLAPAFAAVPNGGTHDCAVVQVLSDPLRRQTLAAGSWRVAFAATLANAGANFTWRGLAALYVVSGTTGLRRGTVFNITAIGSAGRTVTAERSCLQDAVSGAAVEIFTGDYLSLELGLRVINTAGALAPQITMHGDGAVYISADAAAVTDARSLVVAPQELLLSLPTAGEQPNPSFTFAQALQYVKDHYPPGSDRLYDWDAAPLSSLLAFLADVIKIYGLDQVDRVFREFSPLTDVEMLPAWEALLGIAQTRAAQRGKTVAQRRQVQLARLREGGPLTPFNAAAIFAQLAGYVPGTAPTTIQISGAQMQAANLWTETHSQVVPEVADFDGANIVRDTPVLLDGGHCWDAGALVILTLSNTNTAGLRVQLMGPDFTLATWGGTDYPLPTGLSSTIYLRSPAFAGQAIHGSWRLWVRREIGAPAISLASWSLYVLGKGHGGRAQAKFTWSVFIDAAHQTSGLSRRDVESTLDRITQSYARGFAPYVDNSIPGVNQHRPGRFIPGTV